MTSPKKICFFDFIVEFRAKIMLLPSPGIKSADAHVKGLSVFSFEMKWLEEIKKSFHHTLLFGYSCNKTLINLLFLASTIPDRQITL